MRIWKRAAWRKKLRKSSSEFSAIERRFASAIGNFIFILIVRLWGRGFAPAGATKGLSDRPLETFGAVTPMFLELFCYFGKRGWCGYPVDKYAHIA